MEALLSLGGSSVLGLVGIFAAATAIIVEVLKAVLPKSFPTKILTMIVSFVVVLGYTFVFGTITVSSVILAIFGGFVVSFISMFLFVLFPFITWTLFEKIQIKTSSPSREPEEKIMNKLVCFAADVKNEIYVN